MNNYVPPYTITNKMIQLISEISEKVGKLTAHKDYNNKPHLRRSNQIKSIHSSLSIEANSLSLDEVKEVINGHKIIGNKKEIQEVKNAYQAYEYLTKVDPLSLDDLKKIHKIMTNEIVCQSGQFRTRQEGVFSGDVCIFLAPPPHLVNELMNNLFLWMKNNNEIVHPLILSAVFHYEFIFIHPFTDGNGRMARLWHSILLYHWNPIFEFIPIESQIEKYQADYYEAIAQSNDNGNSNVFIEFILKMINQVLDEVIIQIISSNEDTTEYVKKLLHVMEYDIPYTSNDIMKHLGLKSKETLRKNYINPAIQIGYISMTLPDKPNSKNQRYIKK